ncbi:MAG: dTDP-4-dehydrorhamnose 3,5-epimerase [Acidimicrobiia bacterium]|nr:dTDP-4-dehydrorhamnose 3,5-epimerase [Acidimicrobiia bacterium]
MLEITAEHLDGVLELRAQVFGDDRGRFLELGRADELASFGIPELVQLNLSESKRGVLRGIHYQLPPAAQGKLVTVVHGAVWDVAVDLRRSSPTFGRWAGFELSEGAANLVYLPPGFGHGFVVTSPSAIMVYRTTAVFDATLDRAVAFDDRELAVKWPDVGADYLVSAKDRAAPVFAEAELFD